MAWTSQRGVRSGADFERNVYGHLRGSTVIRDGELAKRDGGVDRSQVAEALNDALREVYMRATQRGVGGVERLSATHNFTYASGVECYALDGETQDPSIPRLDPRLPRAYFDLRRLIDRTNTTAGTPEAQPTRIESIGTGYGLRWAFGNGCIYVADYGSAPGPIRAYDFQLVWVPAPEPIDVESTSARDDIPVELHRPIERCAAWMVADLTKNNEAPAMLEMYERDLEIALTAFGQVVSKPRFIQRTRRK